MSLERLTKLRLLPLTVAMPRMPFSTSKARTAVTAALWERRRQASEQIQNATKSRTILTKSPRESLEQVTINFSSSPELRDEYSNPAGGVRFGKVLEDLDAMAGNVAFKFADDGDPDTLPPSIVTAAVDQITIKRGGLAQALVSDLEVQGKVSPSWVGSSSMEIEVCLHTEQELVLTSKFLMVARDPLTGKATAINKLRLETEEDKKLFDQGVANKERRLQEKETSLSIVAPSPSETTVLHSLFTSPPPGRIPLSHTVRQSYCYCQPSERNLGNKVFGGWLMRKGFELAFMTAFLFAQERPRVLGLDDITFHRPVEIGSIQSFEAAVVYTEGPYVVVHVIARVTDPRTADPHVTNTFDFTFYVPERQVPPVLPESYSEGIMYLNGRRKLRKALAAEAKQWQPHIHS